MGCLNLYNYTYNNLPLAVSIWPIETDSFICDDLALQKENKSKSKEAKKNLRSHGDGYGVGSKEERRL